MGIDPNLNVATEVRSPLVQACSNKRYACVRMLLDARADPVAVDGDGTPSQAAKGDSETLKLLMKAAQHGQVTSLTMP